MMILSDLALGTWQLAFDHGFWADQALEDSKATLRYALSHSINHIDTASSYGRGRSEQIIGSLWSTYYKRENLHIDTKFMPKAPHLVEKDLQKSLSRLKTEYVDTLYLHWPSSQTPVLPILDAAAHLIDKKLVKHLGVCNFDVSSLKLLGDLPLSSIQVPCSLLWTRNLASVVDFAETNAIQIVGYSPLGLGLLTGKYGTKPSDRRADLYVYSSEAFPSFNRLLDLLSSYAQEMGCSMAQVALLWARSQGFDTILVGARNPSQLEQSLETDTLELDIEQIQALSKTAQELCSHAPKEWDNLFGHRW